MKLRTFDEISTNSNRNDTHMTSTLRKGGGDGDKAKM